MDQLANRISYLRGLADGMEVNEASREGKILTELIELIDDMYGELLELHARVEETERYAEAIDEDLEDVELQLYGDEADLYETVGDCAEEQQADGYHGFADLDDDESAYVYEMVGDEENEEHFDTSYEFECPSCQEVIFLREGVDDEGYHCYVIEPYRNEAEMQPINPT
jgi:hypothetical protein